MLYSPGKNYLSLSVGNQEAQTLHVHVIAPIDPIIYLFQQLVIGDKVTRWIVRLLEFDVYYIPKKSIKGRVISYFMVDLLTKDQREESFDFLNEESFRLKKTW